jgi:hypothetical protein
VLEFLAMAVAIWLIHLHCDNQKLTVERIVSIGDNTSAIGWIFHSTRLPTDSPYHRPIIPYDYYKLPYNYYLSLREFCNHIPNVV